MAENYLQHAEHYYRIVLSHQPPQTEQAPVSDSEEAEAVAAEADENGATPLVLSRGNEEGDQEVSDKPSRRRGPLRRRRNSEAGDARADESAAEVNSANQKETGAEAESKNVQALELDKTTDQEGEAQVEAGAGDTVSDVSAAANE
jgi:hypothetical protein